MRFVQTDAGRKHSKRPKQKLDCSVRVLALARGLTYDAAYDVLGAAGRKPSRRFKMHLWLDKQKWATLCVFPFLHGKPPMTVLRFLNLFPVGLWILQCDKHVTLVRDGLLYDEHREWLGEHRVYAAWVVQQISCN